MNSYDVLVIILTIALSFSLFVWLIVGILAIQVLRKVKSASDSAQTAAENVAAFTSSLKNAGKATAVGSIIKQAARVFKGEKK